jgi:hypothetical protein
MFVGSVTIFSVTFSFGTPISAAGIISAVTLEGIAFTGEILMLKVVFSTCFPH